MCLVSQRIKPFVAKKDLKVLKLLVKKCDDKYFTPTLRKPVNLGETMECNEKRAYDKGNHGSCYHKPQLNLRKGFIHSFITYQYLMYGWNNNYKIVLAYIPSGTEYYIDIGGEMVCSRRLALSKETGHYESLTLTKEEIDDIMSPIMGLISTENVGPGWLMKYDKTFVHPSEYTDNVRDDIIGVVGSVINGNAIVVGLNEEFSTWGKRNTLVSCGFMSSHGSKVYDVMDGVKCTEDITERIVRTIDDFPAFKYVSEYHTKGTEAGDWYLGAPGELYEMYCNNIDVINFSLWTIGAVTVNTAENYWTSLERDKDIAWTCNLSHCCIAHHAKWILLHARPILSVEL